MYKGTPKNPPVQALKNGLTWHIFMQNENFCYAEPPRQPTSRTQILKGQTQDADYRQPRRIATDNTDQPTNSAMVRCGAWCRFSGSGVLHSAGIQFHCIKILQGVFLDWKLLEAFIQWCEPERKGSSLVVVQKLYKQFFFQKTNSMMLVWKAAFKQDLCGTQLNGIAFIELR